MEEIFLISQLKVFLKNDIKLYVPVVTLSAQENV